MNKIFIIKTKNFGSDIVDELIAYDNEASAIEHIESYKEIYNSTLKANIWYDSLFIKSKFTINEE